MRAIQIDRFGGPEVLEIREVTRPAMGEGEVLVQSIATSINPIDCKLRSKDRLWDFPSHWDGISPASWLTAQRLTSALATE